MKIFSIKENNIGIMLFGLEMIGTAKKPIQVEGTSNVKDWEREQEFWRRKVASVLAAPPHDKEIELKFFSEGTKGGGRLKVYILAKVTANEQKEAKKKLASVWKDLYSVILASKHVYSFNPVIKKKDILACVKPFKAKHRAELSRTGMSFHSSSGPGFYSDKDASDSIVQLPLPLDRETSDLRFLFHFLAEYPSPLAVSIKVSPYTGSLPDIQSYKPLEN